MVVLTAQVNNTGKHLSLYQATHTHGSKFFPVHLKMFCMPVKKKEKTKKMKTNKKTKALKLLCLNKVEMVMLIHFSRGLFLLSRGWLLVGLGPVLMSLTALTWKCYLWSHNRF